MIASPRRRRAAASLLTIAQLGQAHWFFGNLYESVARVPERLADAPIVAIENERVSLGALLQPGSPARYYVPVAPLTVGATVSALVAGWGAPRNRGWLGVSVVCLGTGGLLTARIARDINMKLFFTAQPLSSTEREDLLRRWYRLNRIRLAASGVAWLAAQRARSTPR